MKSASLRASADGRLKADLLGLKDEKAHIRGKMIPFVYAHRTTRCFSDLFATLPLMRQEPAKSLV